MTTDLLDVELRPGRTPVLRVDPPADAVAPSPDPEVATTIVVASPPGKYTDCTPPWSRRWGWGVAASTPSLVHEPPAAVPR